MTEKEVEAPLNKFLEVDEVFQKLSRTLQTGLAQRLMEQKGRLTIDHTATVKDLQERFNATRNEAAGKKKIMQPFEKRLQGRRKLQELKEHASGLDAEVKKATDACGTFLENSGEDFLIGDCVQTLVSALLAYAVDQENSTLEDLFKDVTSDKVASEKVFVKYLANLAENIGRDEVSCFSEERRVDMYKRIASNPKKGVSQVDFMKLFRQEYKCISGTVLNDQADVEGSSTFIKIVPNTVVEFTGERKKAEEAGLIRAKCKHGDQEGWVTLEQGKKKLFQVVSPWIAFSANMEKDIQTSADAVYKVSKEAQHLPSADLSEDSKEALAKMKEQIAASEAAIKQLRGKVKDAKATYSQKETAQKTAHLNARNEKEAAPYLAKVRSLMEEAEPKAKAVQETADPFTNLKDEELGNFETPASTAEQVEDDAKKCLETLDETVETIKARTAEVSQVSPQTPGTAYAKKQLQAIQARINTLRAQVRLADQNVKAKCQSILAQKFKPAVDAIRAHAEKTEKKAAELFDSLKKGDEIPEGAFCKFLQSLGEPKLSREQALLVSREFSPEGNISKDAFTKHIGVFYKIVKAIAFTNAFDTGTCKTIRKGAEDEIVELLEGPKRDDNINLERIRGRAVKDNAEGWLTVSGSKGTTFLELCQP